MKLDWRELDGRHEARINPFGIELVIQVHQRQIGYSTMQILLTLSGGSLILFGKIGGCFDELKQVAQDWLDAEITKLNNGNVYKIKPLEWKENCGRTFSEVNDFYCEVYKYDTSDVYRGRVWRPDGISEQLNSEQEAKEWCERVFREKVEKYLVETEDAISKPITDYINS